MCESVVNGTELVDSGDKTNDLGCQQVNERRLKGRRGEEEEEKK
jgi:hypothetical protein